MNLGIRLIVIFKIYILIFITGNCLFAEEKINCSKHPIYCQILKNKPDINKDYAMKLSSLIYKYSDKYKINSRIFTAILGQESMYNLEAKNCQTGIKVITKEEYNEKVTECNVDQESSGECINNIIKYTKETICFDIGAGQINYKMAEAYKMDVYRLTTDLEYSVEMSAKMLSDIKRRYENKEPIDWWTRYNSSTRDVRDEYEKLVKRRM